MKTRQQISFKATAEDFDTIGKITDRAMQAARGRGIDLSRQSVIMDITAAHCNGNPLRLAELLAADDFNFTHDVFGIMRHIDRTTGELLDCFSPRFSAPEAPHVG